MRSLKWKLVVATGAAALIAGGVTGFADIAAASPATTSIKYVDGFGDVNDDFNDHEREVGVLCDGCDNSTRTDLVVVWQSILASEGHLTGDQVDGTFGAQTTKATKKWQRANDLEQSGEVDQATWARADNNLSVVDEEDGDSYVEYLSITSDGAVSFKRLEDGTYHLLSLYDQENKLNNVNSDKNLSLFGITVTFEAV